jgi:hypothetical protein
MLLEPGVSRLTIFGERDQARAQLTNLVFESSMRGCQITFKQRGFKALKNAAEFRAMFGFLLRKRLDQALERDYGAPHLKLLFLVDSLFMRSVLLQDAVESNRRGTQSFGRHFRGNRGPQTLEAARNAEFQILVGDDQIRVNTGNRFFVAIESAMEVRLSYIQLPD